MLVHGGMAQDVGPILEMVTEKYLLRSEAEWARPASRPSASWTKWCATSNAATSASIGACTQKNFDGPIQTIIPWAGNLYTNTLIERARAAFGDDFWGFWMLGGMCGGGMGFLFSPERKPEAQERLQAIMSETKRRLERSVPFAMEPVVYDFAINERGTQAGLLAGADALMPARYYTLIVPALLRQEAARPLARAPRRAGAIRRRLPQRRRVRRHGRPPLRPPAAARRQAREAGGTLEACSKPTASTASSTSRSRPTCAPAASAWRRTASPSHRDHRRRREPDALDPRHRESGTARAAPSSRWRSSRWPAASAAAGPRARAWSRR